MSDFAKCVTEVNRYCELHHTIHHQVYGEKPAPPAPSAPTTARLGSKPSRVIVEEGAGCSLVDDDTLRIFPRPAPPSCSNDISRNDYAPGASGSFWEVAAKELEHQRDQLQSELSATQRALDGALERAELAEDHAQRDRELKVEAQSELSALRTRLNHETYLNDKRKEECRGGKCEGYLRGCREAEEKLAALRSTEGK